MQIKLKYFHASICWRIGKKVGVLIDDCQPNGQLWSRQSSRGLLLLPGEVLDIKGPQSICLAHKVSHGTVTACNKTKLKKEDNVAVNTADIQVHNTLDKYQGQEL